MLAFPFQDFPTVLPSALASRKSDKICRIDIKREFYELVIHVLTRSNAVTDSGHGECPRKE